MVSSSRVLNPRCGSAHSRVTRCPPDAGWQTLSQRNFAHFKVRNETTIGSTCRKSRRYVTKSILDKKQGKKMAPLLGPRFQEATDLVGDVRKGDTSCRSASRNGSGSDAGKK